MTWPFLLFGNLSWLCDRFFDLGNRNFSLPSKGLVHWLNCEHVSLLSLKRYEISFDDSALSVGGEVLGLVKVNEFDFESRVSTQLPVS